MQVVAHGQKDITSLVSLVRIKVFEVDGGGGGRGEGGGKGRREVENRKLVQLVSILTNQIFRSILDTRADLRERKAELVARAKAAEEKTVASYGTRGEGDLCEREVGSRIRERGEDEEGCRDTIFILENRSHLGYKRDLMQNCEGLDYEHSVLGK